MALSYAQYKVSAVFNVFKEDLINFAQIIFIKKITQNWIRHKIWVFPFKMDSGLVNNDRDKT